MEFDGYAIVSLANESMMDVFFDELSVKHERLVWQENSYYPFGMAIKPLDKEGEPNHRFTYNGKELQEETGYLDYHARQMDSQLGRFMSVDPHAENYFSITSYAYVGNNPIIITDPDGKDWNIVINHDNHTITITANFTTLSNNNAAVQTAANNWTNQSGKFSYVIGRGSEAVTYNVEFNITSNNVSPDRAENSIQVLPDNSRQFQPRTETRTDARGNEQEVTITPQGVSDGRNIAMRQTRQNDTQKIAHEMGHNLGMTHDKGLMGREAGKKLSKNNVKETLGRSNVGEGRNAPINGAQLINTTSVGNAPTNFQTGKLKRNRDWNKVQFN